MTLLMVIVTMRMGKRWNENGISDDGASCFEEEKRHILRGEERIAH